MVDRKVLRVTLQYTDIDGSSNTRISPFSEDFSEYSTVPGIEHIYGELQANPSLKRVEATIVFPPEQITPNLEQSTQKPSEGTVSPAVPGGGTERTRAPTAGVRSSAIAFVLFVVMYLSVELQGS